MLRQFLLVGVPMCLLSLQAVAHHSISVEYDMHTQDTIEGVVSEVWFKAPHVRYYLAVTDEEGSQVTWDTHGHNPITLIRTGWMPDVIQVGDQISITGDVTRNGSPKLFIRTVELASGHVLVSHPGADNSVQ